MRVRRWRRQAIVRTAIRYGLAILAGLLALLPWLLGGTHVEPDPFPLFLGAIMVTSWYGGVGPGLVITLFGALASVYFFLSPGYLVGLDDPRTALQLAVFVCVALSVSWFNALLRRMHRQTKAAETRLRHQLGFTSAVTANLADGLCALDEEGRVTLMNRAAERLLGWTEAELTGRSLHDFVHFQDEDGAPLRQEDCYLLRVFRSRRAFSDKEDAFTRKDGTIFPVACSSSPIVADGSVTGAVISFRDITERKNADKERAQLVVREQEALAKVASAAVVRSVVGASPLPIFTVDPSGAVRSWNAAAERTFGWTQEEVVGQRIPLLPPGKSDHFLALRERVLRGESLTGVDLRVRRKDGSWIDISLSTAPISDSDRYVSGTMYVAADITESKRSEQALRMSEARLAMQYATTRALAQSSSLPEAITGLLRAICERAGWDAGGFWSVDGDVLQCEGVWRTPGFDLSAFEARCREVTYARGAGVPGTVWESAKPEWVEDLAGDEWGSTHPGLRVGMKTVFCFPVLIGDTVHSVVEVLSHVPRKRNPDLERAMAAIGAQVGLYIERKRAEEALEHQALHDALTDLPNRTLLHDRLQQAILSADHEHGSIGLLLMDLDRFKDVNDTFGHHLGDVLLQQVADRVRYTLRESDTVSRLGGDEFAVLLPWADAKGAILTARKLLLVLTQPFRLEDHALDVGASIGIVLYPEHADDANTLLQRADVAMYAAKRANKGYALYSPQHDDHSPGRLTIIGDLRQAIETDALKLHYQPQIGFKTGRIDTVEALLRWEHPTRGMIPPDHFIAMTEQTGLINQLNRWVMNAAIRQWKQWHKMGLDIHIAINLSASTLHDPYLLDTVVELLAAWKVQPSWVEVEITETAIMVDSSRAMEILTQLHEMGVRISIDDFGTGYSSLTYLQRLPVDQIKIDKSFVLDMAASEDDAFIARSVIELGHNLGLQVVAEGVKDRETWNLLAAMGCDFAQGFYLSRPLAEDALHSWLIQPREAAGQ